MTKAPIHDVDYNSNTIACLSKVKRIFFLTLLLMCVIICAMFYFSGYTERLNSTMTPLKTNRNAISETYRLNNQNYSFLKRKGSGYYSRSDTKLNSSGLYLNTTSVKIQNIEFPGMPDPCAEPRRYTGVEDILCMERPTFLPDYKNPCWYDNGEFRCLPYFHLFGVCKSGTTDLFKRILLHPELVPNKGIFGKEVWYWSWKRFSVTKTPSGKLKPEMTLKDFTSKFYADKIKAGVDKKGFHPLITGHGDPMDFWDRFLEEKTPQNTPGDEELLWTTPYSVRHINPDVRLLLMLRDPIDRLYSHYFHSKAGTSAKSFDEHIRISITHWKDCLANHTVRSCIYNKELRGKLKAPIYTSFYSVHMKEWLKVFPRTQIHILRTEDYAADMATTLKDLFKFLVVEPPGDQLLKKMVDMPHFYETAGKKAAGPMFNTTRELLVDLYRPYTEDLAQLLNDTKFAFKDGSFS